MKRKLITLATVLSLTLTAGLSYAKAYTVNVGGGTWYYGHSGKYSYSNYYHPTRYHSSTVRVGNYYASSGTAIPRTTSYASAKSSWWHVEQFYHNAW